MNDSIIFLSGLTLIFIHEMDAIRCREWRIFPGLSTLDDKAGQTIFLLAHIPIVYWIFWQFNNSNDIEIFRVCFDIFLIGHFGLHLIFLKHKNNKFKDWTSWTIIAGAGVCGLLDLMLK